MTLIINKKKGHKFLEQIIHVKKKSKIQVF